MGPARRPPSDTFEYRCPRARAARSVHCNEGASKFTLLLRRMKFELPKVRRENCAPLNPPRLTSYGVVTREDMTCASRGMLEAPKLAPLSVVLFWSAERPSTEKPAGSPLASVIGVTPGIVAAIAFRSPCSPEETASLCTDCSVPLRSG